jgi:capsular polysaccharide transport system permease protein
MTAETGASPAGEVKGSNEQRSHWAVFLSVWQALFMREALARVAAGRAGWLWLLVEPAAHIAMLMVFFASFRQGKIAGTDFALFLALGLIGFRLFANPAQRSSDAINANRALLAYRQVKPVDAVLVRAAVEGALLIFVSAVLLIGSSLFGIDVVPHDPLTAAVGLALLWILGTGFGLMLSAGSTLVPEIGKLTGLIFTPLYFVSGVLFSPAVLPAALQKGLLFNPVLHGLELVRSGFFPGYHLLPGVSGSYLAGWALAFAFLGLALHRRFAVQLAAQ